MGKFYKAGSSSSPRDCCPHGPHFLEMDVCLAASQQRAPGAASPAPPGQSEPKPQILPRAMERSTGGVWDPHLWGYVKACWASPPSCELWTGLIGRQPFNSWNSPHCLKQESLKCTFSEKFGKGHGCHYKEHRRFAWMRAQKLSGGWMHLLGRRNVGKPLALFSDLSRTPETLLLVCAVRIELFL